MNRILLVVVWCIAQAVVGNAVGAVDAAGAAVDNADNCDCQCDEGRVRRLLGAAARGRLLPVHVRRGVPEISADTSLDTSIARRHAIAASSQCLIRAGTSASARRAPARRTPARCVGGPSRTCSASSSPDLLITIIIVIVVGVQRLLYID